MYDIYVITIGVGKDTKPEESSIWSDLDLGPCFCKHYCEVQKYVQTLKI